MTDFNLSTVFATVAAAVPDQEVVVWRDRRVTYAEMDRRVDGLAHFLVAQGLGCHTERADLAGHESGQDHVGIYLRNGPEYLESMVAGYRSRTAAFNVNYRYVEEELLYLLSDADTKGLVYHAEFAPMVASVRDRLPGLRVLVQVADGSGNALLPGAVDYEEAVRTPPPAAGMPTPSGDDLFLIYTGGTTGMPKGVLWRQADIYVNSMGGTPFGASEPFASYDAIGEAAKAADGGMGLLMIPPLMHGAAQWSTFFAITSGGRIVFPDDVHRFDPANALMLAARERVASIPTVGDAIARPLVEEMERTSYDLSGLFALGNGGAALTPTVRERLFAVAPHVMVLDSAGASETGLQASQAVGKGGSGEAMVFTPQNPDTTVVDDLLTRVLQPGESGGWLARKGQIPLGYLGDPAKTARTFPVIDGVRWAVPGDRANLLEDGRIQLLGRESVTINSGGEKIFVEEVERAMAAHPAVRDVVVAGRPSERWGSEVVAIVQLEDGSDVTDEELVAECARHVARYKLPKGIVRVPSVQRSPAGKADYRWAKEQAGQSVASTT
ncbi:acyl-CoA synthetase [Nocardioides lianchengensis]|uniref:Fatty-acyl-CoA synthase n=1 Tax=Nocardioides lianchengensis TaxID=1045774 RepID=A0A1G6X245_9ACTN|nr:acyl-CoA synthetase [Nocardioides lianchengensis]NYG09141.1 fatty-acyl-CoA synthase [Nocardioides lianchengensis]SDD71365.1 fatty-acyl-CoA synthase [Nocardioides lianchengensis]